VRRFYGINGSIIYIIQRFYIVMELYIIILFSNYRYIIN
jgi:hypothetical protein